MFGWRSRACTLDPVTREWLERRWEWLATAFAGDTLPDAPTVLPTSEFFPDRYDESDEAVRRLVDRVCGYMRIDPRRVDLECFTDRTKTKLFLVNERGHRIGGRAGSYQAVGDRHAIRLERGQFGAPATLVGTVAHELAHARLLGEGRLQPGAFDNELLTDLTVAFHGLGVFLANCPRHWDSHVTKWPGTDVFKPEYMTTPMWGYALARRCWLRHETRPPKWKRALNPGVRAEFEQSLRFLEHESRQGGPPTDPGSA